ncbi:hypothetical protein HU200_042535 [Digitaria exilis]|uniref:Phytocyanin domain-containing protein n=1 Tax=Digitaria exilis TaxID=1010633 RepID=A0A835EEP7_9POAL|nr:hypothetical protein HU200_042535 [Digitaria exilis]
MAHARVALALCVLLLVLHGVPQRAYAASYNVGDRAGWDLSADLPSWANGKTFYVGDVLVFQYSKYHTLDEVDEAGFNNCSAANAILSQSDGNTTLHCLSGMKLHVLVNQPAGGGGGGGAPAGAPPSPPQAALPPSADSTDDDAGVPRLFLGGSHRTTVGPLLVAWLLVAAALLV